MRREHLEWDGFGWSLEQEPEGVDNPEKGAIIPSMAHFSKSNYPRSLQKVRTNLGVQMDVMASYESLKNRGVDNSKEAAKLPSMTPPDNFADLMAFMVSYKLSHPDQRTGQAYFNALDETYAELADQIRGTDLDPFYNDVNLNSFFDYLIGEVPSE